MRISDWSSDVCSSDLLLRPQLAAYNKFQAGARKILRRSTSKRRHWPEALHRDWHKPRSYQPLQSMNVPLPDWPIRSSHVRPYRLPASAARSEEHTSELQSLMRISYAVFCLKKTTQTTHNLKS